MHLQKRTSYCSGLLLAALVFSVGTNDAKAVPIYYFYDGVMLDNGTFAGNNFVAGSAFSAIFKFDDEDYLETVTLAGFGIQEHRYVRGVLPGQTGPNPGDVEPTNPPHGVDLVRVSFDFDNSGAVETTYLRTSTADNNGDTIPDGAPSVNGRIELKDNIPALGGNDWFNWRGSAQSKDVAVIGIPPVGWINFLSAGQDTAPPTNALMTSIQTQLFNAGGLGIRLGVGGGGTFFGEPGARITSFRFSNNIPEPSSLILLGLGVVCSATSRARRRA